MSPRRRIWVGRVHREDEGVLRFGFALAAVAAHDHAALSTELVTEDAAVLRPSLLLVRLEIVGREIAYLVRLEEGQLSASDLVAGQEPVVEHHDKITLEVERRDDKLETFPPRGAVYEIRMLRPDVVEPVLGFLEPVAVAVENQLPVVADDVASQRPGQTVDRRRIPKEVSAEVDAFEPFPSVEDVFLSVVLHVRKSAFASSLPVEALGEIVLRAPRAGRHGVSSVLWVVGCWMLRRRRFRGNTGLSGFPRFLHRRMDGVLWVVGWWSL